MKHTSCQNQTSYLLVINSTEKVQGAKEPFEQLLTDLRLLVKDCNYANNEEMVRDRVMLGIQSPKVREKLLSVGSDLTLDKAIDIVRSHDIAQAQLKTVASGNSGLHEQTVHAINRHYSRKTAWKTRQDKATGNMESTYRPDGDKEHHTTCG
ncbi:hypothetical protein JOB18_016283 [Solea senegalensis]|uniref:Uncharacterized protein n=1 Tax=Solea senegalensis TaxID=28829 RepID=A0AAV6PZE1_SOLSE|nr:hypothetical protein JOB18_016283 [Solea senegalensis]